MRSTLSIRSAEFVVFLALLAMFFPCVAHALTAATDSPNPVSQWTASDAQLALLGQPTVADGYTLSLPIGFVTAPTVADTIASKMPQGTNAQVSAWRGAMQMNGASPIMVLITTVLPDSVKGDIPPDSFLVGFLKSYQHTRTDVVQSKIALGQLNGLPAARAYWKNAIPRADGHAAVKMRGFAYVVYNAQTRTAVIVYAEDTAADYANGASAAMEASALTLKPTN